MPIRFHWDLERRLLRTTMTGGVTEAEFLQYIRDIWQRPDRASFDEVADCRTMDTRAMTPEVMFKATQLSVELNRERRYFRVAFVVAGKLGYGVGRQYETYREATPTETRMFTSMEDAERWIEESRQKTGEKNR
jgi:hypothetical protein